jgi:4-amino-4-deoxy-L-arabinose transferase-like glycosyltransferase
MGTRGAEGASRPHALPAKLGLAAVVAAYCTLAVVQSFATRLQWGPDEPGHIVYVQSLALDGRLPGISRDETDDAYLPGAARTHEAHQPPLYYVLAAAAWRVCAGFADQPVSYVAGPSGEVVRFTVPGAVRPVRLFSVLLGVVTLLLTWASARTVFPQRPAIWLGAVGLLAFTPMFTYVTGVINNDPLLHCFFAATAWQWARVLRFGRSRRDIVILGLLAGLAINVKETALAIVPLSALVLAVEPGAASWRSRAVGIAGMVGLSLALPAWWYGHKWLIYGHPFSYAYYTPLTELPEARRGAVVTALPGAIFLFSFVPADVVHGHLRLGLAALVFGGLGMLSVGGLAVACLRGKSRPLARYEAQTLALWLLTAALVLAGLLRNALFLDWRMGLTGGRYMVTALPLLAPAAARGLSALFGDGRWAKVVLAAAVLVLLAMNLSVIRATALGYGTLRFLTR